MRTSVTELLGIRYPILQGGMAWVSTPELVAAVSNAGGAGILSTATFTPDEFRKMLRRTKELTDKPFGANIMLLSSHSDLHVEVCCSEGVPFVSTGAGTPGKFMSKFKEAGIKVVAVVPSLGIARRVVQQGVDAVVGEGSEAGGHVGDMTTMVLTRMLAQGVDLPTIAAGGIADGRGMAAALTLGADGVQVGTRFIASEECVVHPNFKEAIVRASDRSTRVSGRPTGHPIRSLKNRLTSEFHKLESHGADPRELERLGTGRLRAAVREGDVEYGSVMAGQCASLVGEVMPAADIIEELVAECREALRETAERFAPEGPAGGAPTPKERAGAPKQGG